MTTKSLIGIWRSNNVIEGVYCHYDGDPGHQIPLLKQYSRDDIKRMLANRKALRVLGETLESCKYYEAEQIDIIDFKFRNSYGLSGYDYIYGLQPDGSWKYVSLLYYDTPEDEGYYLQYVESVVVIDNNLTVVKI